MLLSLYCTALSLNLNSQFSDANVTIFILELRDNAPRLCAASNDVPKLVGTVEKCMRVMKHGLYSHEAYITMEEI